MVIMSLRCIIEYVGLIGFGSGVLQNMEGHPGLIFGVDCQLGQILQKMVLIVGPC